MTDHAHVSKSVAIDARRIRTTGSFQSVPMYVYVYQVETGRLIEVGEATEIGRAS